MSKKHSLIINMIMIIVGIVGMFLFFSTNNGNKQIYTQKPAMENITVITATKKLKKGIYLSPGNYKLKTLTVQVNSNDAKQFSVTHPVEGWLISSEVEEGSYIPVSSLVKPGSAEYIHQSLSPGSVIYDLPIRGSDGYLFHNTSVGDGIDVYLSYGLKKIKNDSASGGGVIPTISSTGIDNKHFKILLKDKKILSMNRPKSTANKIKDSLSPSTDKSSNEGFISIELSPSELKTLKGLDGAKLYIFPSADGINNLHSALSGDEKQWPIDNGNILSVKVISEQEQTSETAREYRGGK